MTATDELRRLLDERGVDYRVSATGYSIDIGPYITAYANRSDTTLDVSLRQVTPAQAIAATLGKEPDDAAMLKLHDRMNATLLEYERALGSEKADGAITVPFVAEMHHLLEEAATLGSDIDATATRQLDAGTCHDKGNIERFICSGCGCRLVLQDEDWEPTMWLDDGTATVPRFCPNCGARVEDE